MRERDPVPSARRSELLEAAYGYALEHGLADLSLRPLAAAIGSSPRVLIYLFGSKDGLVRALLDRARVDELAALQRLPRTDARSITLVGSTTLTGVAKEIWAWLASPDHRPLLRLWTEAYARSLVEPDGAWSGFAHATVEDWLSLRATTQPVDTRDTPAGEAQRTMVLAVLRGALLDLLATGDQRRVTAAVDQQLALLE